MIAIAPKNLTLNEIRKAEIFVIEATEASVVYVYPNIMERNCDYIYDWNKDLLFELTDFTDKIVLDVGSGTGRLASEASLRK